ncbi:hypothetical protein ACO0LF_01040 [Undibacterium sp. Di27W]|uniref:hypothetical protein n=1 Tax=Undibacterium sp. Di27W TaxID=3413036 RepID=UPI003BEFCDF6
MTTILSGAGAGTQLIPSSSASQVLNLNNTITKPATVAADAASVSSVSSVSSSASTDSSPSYQLDLRTARTVLVPLTYNQSGFAPVATTHWLENKGDDDFSYLIEQNAKSSSVAGRFKGISSALFEHFQTTHGDFKQAVIASQAGQGIDARNVADISQAKLSNLRDFADQSLGLSVTLASGRSVDFVIKNNADGLSVEASSSSELTDSESRALEKLAAGLEKTANSYFTDQHINLDALTGIDSFAFSSLKLDIKAGEKELNFSIDQSHHQLSIKSASGSINIDVSHDNSGLRGNAAQRNKAIQQFIGQIDSAGDRGNADKELLSLYKEAFTAVQKINTEDDATDFKTQLPGRVPSFWDNTAQPLLTGLADFDAKLSGVPSTPNPARLQESDYFNLQFSQKTTEQGYAANGSISQVLQSRLSAAFHQELKSNEKPVLGKDANAQNYRYSKVEDSASSKLVLGFDKNQLNSVSLEKNHDRSLTVSRYEQGKLVNTQNHPDTQDSKVNLHVDTGPNYSESAQALQRLRIVISLTGQNSLD